MSKRNVNVLMIDTSLNAEKIVIVYISEGELHVCLCSTRSEVFDICREGIGNGQLHEACIQEISWPAAAEHKSIVITVPKKEG